MQIFGPIVSNQQDVVPSFEVLIVVGITSILGLTGTVLRVMRSYGDEFLEFAKWFKTFVSEMRKLKK